VPAVGGPVAEHALLGLSPEYRELLLRRAARAHSVPVLFSNPGAYAQLDRLPEGVLGGERDYRYLTQSQGPWLREREKPTERVTAPAVNRVRSIKSPLPAGIAVFVVVLAGTAMWGSHVAAMRNKVVPAALKALPVEDDEPETEGGTKDGITDLKARHVSLPVRKADPVN
jgi:hypothetical protein